MSPKRRPKRRKFVTYEADFVDDTEVCIAGMTFGLGGHGVTTFVDDTGVCIAGLAPGLGSHGIIPTPGCGTASTRWCEGTYPYTLAVG